MNHPNLKHLVIICMLYAFLPVFTNAQQQLTFVNRNTYGEGGIYGLRGPLGITISPDKKHIYTTAYKSMSVFSFDSLTGNLSFIKTYLDHEDGFEGLENATCIAVSKDNKNVYVTSDSWPYYIGIFDRDISTGLLTIRNIMNGAPVILNAYEMELTDDNKFLYLTSWNDKKVTTYARDTVTGNLTWLQSVNGGAWPESIQLSVDNKFIYVTSFIDNTIHVFERDSQGLLSLIQSVTNGVGGVQGLYNVRNLIVSHDNKFLYSAGHNSIAVFSRNILNGNLTYVSSYTDSVGGIDGIEEIFSMTIPPDNKSLHVITSGDSSLTTFLRDTTTGLLTYANSIKMINNPYPPFNIYSTSSLISTNTELAFTWYWGFSIKTYHRDPVTAALSFNNEYVEGQGVTTTGLREASHAAISADKKAVYVSAYNDVSILSRNDTLGKLTFQNSIKGDSVIQGLTNAIGIIITPDNKYVYVAGNYDDAIVVFARDTVTNNLNYIQTIFNNQLGVTGLDGVKALAISPDAKFIYAGSEWDNAVVVFNYDSSNGSLTFIQKIDLFNILGSTVTVDKVKVTSDGKYLFAPGSDAGFFWFKRDTITGLLTFLDWYHYNWVTDGDISTDVKNVYVINSQFDKIMSFSVNSLNDSIYLIQVLNADSDHIEMIRNPRVISISNDDRFVFVTSLDSNSVTMFQRRPDGKLEFVKSYNEGQNNFEGLDGISSVAFSQDNKNIYFTSDVENGIAAYKLGAFLGNDVSACVGDSIVLTPGSRYNTYNWSTGATTGSIIVTTDGNYSVSVTDEYGITESDTVNVHFNNLPVVFLGPDIVICPGDQLFLNAGNNFESYEWNTGDSTHSISVPGGAVYSVLVVDSNGCKNSDTISIGLHSIPVVDLGPDTGVCDNVHFMLIPNTGGNVIEYLWSTGDTTQVLPVNNTGNYYLTVTDSNQCVNSDSVHVTVYQSPQISLGNDTTIHINQSIKIGSYGFISYLWSTGDTIPKITINQSSFTTDSLIVWVEVTNSYCSSVDSIIFHLDSTYMKDYFGMIDTNKIWHIAECTGLNDCGTSILQFEGDTAIGINLYKKLIVNQDSGGVGTYYPVAAREDTITKQVFFYSGNSEYLAYDFSLTEGDHFTTNINGCVVQRYVLYTDRIVLLNGESRKIMYMSNLETWIEGIGGMSGLPNSGLNTCMQLDAELNCFTEDDTLKFHNINFTTCFYNLVGVQDVPFDNMIMIYPNPFSEFTTIKFENPEKWKCTISIYDMKSQLIKEFRNIVSDRVEIEKGSLESGVYFVRVWVKEREYVLKMVVE